MLKNFTTKNIENYKYELSVLKNNKLITDKDKNIIFKCENSILIGKYFSRSYITMEIILLTMNYKIRKMALAFLRINCVWITSNIITNYYLQNSNLKRIISKYKTENFNFNKYIEHRK